MDFNFFIGALLWLIALFTGITAYCICLAVVERIEGDLKISMQLFLQYMRWMLMMMIFMTAFAMSAAVVIGGMMAITEIATR